MKALLKKLPDPVLDPARVVRFHLSRLRGFEVGNEPFMPLAGAQFLRDHLAKAQVYLEYGSGGSTVLASSYPLLLVTVESDRRFLDAALAKASGGRAEIVAVHAALGVIGPGGSPIVNWPKHRSIEKGRRYTSAPWEHLTERRAMPDLILVDGRYRVAATLESLLRLPAHSNALFVVDDFAERDYYQPILEFAEKPEYIDRLLAFRRASSFDAERCALVREAHLADHR